MVPSIKKILSENLPSYSWLSAIVDPLNKFMDDTWLLFNKRITFTANLDAEIKTATLDGVYPVYVSWGRPSKPIGAWLIAARELSGSHTAFSNGLYLDWEVATDGRIKINGVTGISPTPTAKYTITFVAITG